MRPDTRHDTVRRLRPYAAAAPALLLLLLWLGGCGESSTTGPPPPPVSTLTGVEGNIVSWTVDEPTRGSVRYGFASGQYDRIAYPPVAGGLDEVYARTHSVPLLSAAAGATIYIQRVDEKEDGTFFSTAEETVTVAADLAAPPPLLRFTAIDVQFGDSHVMRLPSEDRVVMIDAGDPSESRGSQHAPEHVMAWLDDHGIERIDVALVTHIHYDHYGGFLQSGGAIEGGVLDNYQVGMFLDVPAVSDNENRHRDLQDRCDDYGIPRPVIAHGMTSASDPDKLGWDPQVTVQVLNAGAEPEWAGGNINNDSVVLKIGYGAVDLISGADCEVPCENFILARYADALAGTDYFKVFHHGRNAENSANWLGRVRPRVATVPIAFSAYNEGWQGGYNATEQVLGRLADVGSDVFRFDDAAPIRTSPDHVTFWHTTFATDGASFEVRIEPSVW